MSAVCLPDDAQWLSSRLLRSYTDIPQLARPNKIALQHSRPERQSDAIVTSQHCLRSPVRHLGSLPRISFLPGQDPSTIFLAIPSSWNTTSIPQRSRWNEADLQCRRDKGPLERCGTSHGTDRLWIVCAITDILLREEVTATELRHQRWHAFASDVVFSIRHSGGR